MPTPTQLNFFDLVTRYDDLSHNGDTLESLAFPSAFGRICPCLKAILHRSKRKQGDRPPFDSLLNVQNPGPASTL